MARETGADIIFIHDHYLLMSSDYDDIIDLPHHVSKRYPQMPMAKRAAQFSSFAALTGHKAALQETARMTQKLEELSADRREMLDRTMLRLRERLADRPGVRVTYFEPDGRKAGGCYHRVDGKLIQVNDHDRYMELATPDGPIKIAFQFIVDLDDLNVLG